MTFRYDPGSGRLNRVTAPEGTLDFTFEDRCRSRSGGPGR